MSSYGEVWAPKDSCRQVCAIMRSYTSTSSYGAPGMARGPGPVMARERKHGPGAWPGGSWQTRGIARGLMADPGAKQVQNTVFVTLRWRFFRHTLQAFCYV